MRGQPADSARIESLENDLAFERTILASFEGEAETAETIQETTATKRKIMKLKQQLSEARGIFPKGYLPLSLEDQARLLLTSPFSSAPQSSTGVVTNNTGGMDYLQRTSDLDRPPSRLYIWCANAKLTDPTVPVRFPRLPNTSGMSTPSDSSSSGGPSSGYGVVSRKRSFSNAQMGVPQGWTDNNKSRRTTPSPMNSNDPTPSPDPFDDDFGEELPVIDLTGYVTCPASPPLHLLISVDIFALPQNSWLTCSLQG